MKEENKGNAVNIEKMKRQKIRVRNKKRTFDATNTKDGRKKQIKKKKKKGTKPQIHERNKNICRR
jgi:hypothetical protein